MLNTKTEAAGDIRLNRNPQFAFDELEKGVFNALTTYSNIHRGSGYNSMVTTALYEKAREIVLDHLGLDSRNYIVIFCTPMRAELLKSQLKQQSFLSISSKEIGISLGLVALAVRKKDLPSNAPFQTGGGTTRLISADWVIWADGPCRFEAGTPAIINVIAFALALKLIMEYGNNAFLNRLVKNNNAILHHDDPDGFSGKELLEELRKTLIGKNLIVPTIDGDKPYVNLDNAASTPTFLPVWKAVCETWRQSEYLHQSIIDEVRLICSQIIGAPLKSYDIVFTSNTTEAINLAAMSFLNTPGDDIESVVLNTLLEHTSNELPWRLAEGVSLLRMEIDEKGFINPGVLDKILREYNHDKLHGNKRIRLFAISGASNVLGACNNLYEISKIVHRYNTQLLVDAAQLIAHRSISMEECGIDYLVFSAHKVYAPFGTGVLAARKGLLKFSDSESEIIRTSGEENVIGIVALGKSLLLLKKIGFDLIKEEEQALTRIALQNMKKIDGINIYGIKDHESQDFSNKGGVIVFSVKGMMSNKVASELAVRGIGVRYGCHCAHLLVKRILNVGPGLERFQRFMLRLLPGVVPPGVTRISMGIQNTTQDIDTFIAAIDEISRKSGSGSKETFKKMNDSARGMTQKVYF